jgi:hypothetical protein
VPQHVGIQERATALQRPPQLAAFHFKPSMRCRFWHVATNPKAQNLRSVLMQSGHLWTSGLGRICSE